MNRTVYETRPPKGNVIINRDRPYLTYLLCAVNVIMFGVEFLLGGTENTRTLVLLGAKVNVLIAMGEYWRLITPVFLHAGFEHLLFNTFSLVAMGTQVEALFGRARLLIVYFLAGISSSLMSYCFGGEISVGASGAIFGLCGALFMIARAYRPFFKRAVGMQLVVVVILNLFLGFRGNIDNWGHIGGLIGGYLVAEGVGLSNEIRPVWIRALAIAAYALLAATALWYGYTRVMAMYGG